MAENQRERGSIRKESVVLNGSMAQEEDWKEASKYGIQVVTDEWEMREQRRWHVFFQGLCSCMVVKRWRLHKAEREIGHRKSWWF